MYAIPKALVVLSVILLPMALISIDKLQRTDPALSADGFTAQMVPHRVDMQMLANAFN
jgi:hypothetical protein